VDQGREVADVIGQFFARIPQRLNLGLAISGPQRLTLRVRAGSTGSASQLLSEKRMMIELIAGEMGHRFRIAPRTFGKLLHLARFHGWRPERAVHEWPSEAWDTKVILPHLGAYMPGPVTRSDSSALADALRKVMVSESGLLEADEYLPLLALLKVTSFGAFEVKMITEEEAATAIDHLTISDPPTQAEVQALRDKCDETASAVQELAGLVRTLQAGFAAMGVVRGADSQMRSAYQPDTCRPQELPRSSLKSKTQKSGRGLTPVR